MENQNNNIENYNENPKPQMMRLGIVFWPIILKYLVGYAVEIIFCVVILFAVTTNYMYETPEILAIVEESVDVSAMTDSIDEIMTDEVLDMLFLETIEVFENNLVIFTIISALASIPIFIFLMYRDKKKWQFNEAMKKNMLPIQWYAAVIVGSACLCLVLNNLITLSQLAETSASYQESSNLLYSISFPLQILAWGIITPISEEILFRGVIFKRLRNYMKPAASIFWSALLFGVYHVNLVQFIYALICGIVFAWLYEEFGSIKAPIIAHIAMNIMALVLTQYEIFVWMFTEQIRVVVITTIASTIAAVCYVLFTNTIRKNLETE